MKIILQNRDNHIFRELSLCRFLTLRQIAKLCFEGRTEAAKKRLQKLCRGGFVARHSPGITSESIYLLTSAGCRVANQTTKERPARVCRPPAVTTLQHELKLRDCRVMLLTALGDSGTFSLDSKALSFAHPRGITCPDGYFEIQGQQAADRFFLEFDNGTESLQTLVDRVLAYRYFYRSGGFAERFGGDSPDYRAYPFRILMIFARESRVHSFRAELAKNGIRKFVVMGTYNAFSASLFEAKNQEETC